MLHWRHNEAVGHVAATDEVRELAEIGLLPEASHNAAQTVAAAEEGSRTGK